MHFDTCALNTADDNAVINRPDLGLYGIVTGTSQSMALAKTAANFAAARLEKMFQTPDLPADFTPSQALANVHRDLVEHGEEKKIELETTAVLVYIDPQITDPAEAHVAAWGTCRAFCYRPGQRRQRLIALSVDNTKDGQPDIRHRTLQQSAADRRRHPEPPGIILRLGDPKYAAIRPRLTRQKLLDQDSLILLDPEASHEHTRADLLNIVRTCETAEEVAQELSAAIVGTVLVITVTAA